MSATKSIAAAVAVASLCGCGTYVPEIQDFGGRVEGQQLVQAILTNITCELRDAVVGLHEEYPKGTFLDSWGIQTTLTLTIDEKGAIAPSVLWTPPSPASAVFSLASGVNFSADATRKDVINAYFLVSDLVQARCSPASRPNGAFLLQSDLKLSEWLFDAVSASLTRTVDFKNTALAGGNNILQHEVTFVIDTSANATPTWTFKLVTVNPGGPFLNLDRSRSNDLLITMGPAVPSVVVASKKGGKFVSAVTREPDRRAAD